MINDLIDDIGLCYPFSIPELLAMRVPRLLKLQARAQNHLAMLYSTKL